MTTSTKDSVAVTVTLLGKSFKIMTPSDRQQELQNAANYLNEKMLVAQRKDRFSAVEQLAIVAALNITHEFLTLQGNGRKATIDKEYYKNQLDELTKKISDEVLAISS